MKIRKLLFLFAILFATNAKAQYKYLGSFTSSGLPNYLVTSDVISAASLAQIRNALPEGYPVPVYNPHYIISGYDSEVMLIDSAEVFVTFVDEGAGYKNVLGFYTYNLSNPIEKYGMILLPESVNAGNLQVSDASGNLVRNENFSIQNGEYVFDRKNLASGMYFFSIKASDQLHYSGNFLIR